jgi:hypothetical protein
MGDAKNMADVTPNLKQAIAEAIYRAPRADFDAAANAVLAVLRDAPPDQLAAALPATSLFRAWLHAHGFVRSDTGEDKDA